VDWPAWFSGFGWGIVAGAAAMVGLAIVMYRRDRG